MRLAKERAAEQQKREEARRQAGPGLMRHHNEYIHGTLQNPGTKPPFNSPDEALDKTAFGEGAVATIGTPDDLVAKIKSVLAASGGFGTVYRAEMTDAGGFNRTPLPDGSVIELNADTEVRVRFTRGQRLVRPENKPT